MSNARTIADLAAVTATATELNALDGITSNVTELNTLDGITANVTELNLLDGVTATTAEINYVDGVTSNVQTQLDSKVGANYTGDVDITGELLVDSYNETFKKVSSVGVTTGYLLSSASYDSVSFNVSTQEAGAQAVTFNSDGTKMYVIGYAGDDVNEYTLSTAYNPSTATYSTNFSVATQDANPLGMTWKPDGTKFYIAGNTNDTIFQYSCSTAYSVASASYDSVSFSVATQDTNPTGVAFNSDGTKMFVSGKAGQDINEYSLSTAYDVSTASYTTNFSVSSQETQPEDLEFSSDGTKLFVVGQTGDSVYQYNLTTGFDLSTASYASISFSVASQDTSPAGLTFNSDGTKMYIAGDSSDSVHQYSVSATTYSTTFDCENANVFETVLDANTTVVFSNPPASGTPVATNYVINEASYDSVSFSVSSQESFPTDVTFGDSGTKMYIIGYNTDTVYQYTLTTAYDISTASYASKSFSVATQETNPRGLNFNSDGTKLYVMGQATDAFYQYSLSTAWDVSTASYDSVSFSVSGQDASPLGFTFKPDGTKLFMIGATNDTVFQYSLSTAFDLSTASYDSVSFSVASQDTGPVDVLFNNDGTKMFMVGATNDTVFQYSLSTAYDLSTASYDSISFSVASQTTSPSGFEFNGDGTKLAVVGQNGTVYQYTVGTSSLNDSTAYAMSLKVVQDSGASGYTVTWPTSVDWPSATAPTLTATASAVDQFVFYTYDGGTTWYGFTAGQALG